MFCCPEGAEEFSPGFNPGNRIPPPIALKGLQFECLNCIRQPVKRMVISGPFRANRVTGWFPGLEPWAKFFSPFGAAILSRTSLIFARFWAAAKNQ